MNKRVITIIFFLLGSLAFTAITIAQPGGPSSISLGASSRANLSGGTPASVTAQAGNVTELDIDTSAITQAWQGYFGNISGNIVLADSNNNQFYNWTGIAGVSGEVFASRNDSVTWATINCTNSTENAAEESFLGKTASDADSLTNTFSSNNHPSFLIGGFNVTENSCNSTNAYINTGSSSTDYYQVLLADGSSNIVYTTLIDDNQAGFDGNGHDFELLVGENGNSTEATTLTTYYFYVEMS